MKCVALYSSGMTNDLGRHWPVRPLDRDASAGRIVTKEERETPGHFVYRCYSATRAPLYVGMSGALELRLIDHRRTSSWWALAEYIAVSRYDSNGEARKAETAAIEAERPAYNRQGIKSREWVEVSVLRGARKAAEEIHSVADPAFVRELARLLASPELFTEVPPPPPNFGA